MSLKMMQCQFCRKECKVSDSRPCQGTNNNNSTDEARIHNRCHIKKTLADRRQRPSSLQTTTVSTSLSKPADNDSKQIDLLINDTKDELIKRKAENERKFLKILDGQKEKSANNFFFDLKSGIAHEKKRYLHHKKLSEITVRYDDQGFQAEEVGRAYDHTGRDLNVVESSSEEGDNDVQDINGDKKKKASKDIDIAVNKRSKLDNHDSRPHGETIRSERVSKNHKERHGVTITNERPCWFCLASPSVDKRLIIAIGEHCYLALTKGGLVDNHMLILPIEHISSLNDPRNSDDLLQELEKFQQSLVSYYRKQSKGVVFFERNFRSVHWQLQSVPIDLSVKDLSEKIEHTSKKIFKNSEYIEIPKNLRLRDIVPQKAPYFYWHLEPSGIKLAMQIQMKGAFFPVQFGREVLADKSLLNTPERIDWKVCVLDNYEELVKRVKDEYLEFDFT